MYFRSNIAENIKKNIVAVDLYSISRFDTEEEKTIKTQNYVEVKDGKYSNPYPLYGIVPFKHITE